MARDLAAWRQPAIRLLFLALGSLMIYVFSLVRPYNIFEWWQQPLETIARMSNYDKRAGVLYVLAFLALFALYAAACRLALNQRSPRAWGIVIGGAFALNAALWWMYPADSADIFDNILRGRLQALYGANPFYQRPSSAEAFQNDPFYNYAAWHDYPTAYGPGWELIAAQVGRVAGDKVIENVIAFKLLNFLAYAGTALLLARTLDRVAPARALSGVVFFAWNPLVLFANAGNGHNDAVMIFFVILGFFFLARGQFTLATLAEIAGALIKFIPILLVPVMIVAALKSLRHLRARVRFLVITGLAGALLAIAAYAPFWRDDAILRQDWRARLYTTSLPTLFQVTLAPHLGEPLANDLISRAAVVVLAAWVAAQLIAQWKGRDAATMNALHAALAILLFYLLVVCLWFQAWYVSWVIALAALMPDRATRRLTALLSLAAMWKMPIFDFALMVRPPDNVLPIPVREWGVTLGTLGLPWLYAIFLALQSWRSHRTVAVGNFKSVISPQ